MDGEDMDEEENEDDGDEDDIEKSLSRIQAELNCSKAVARDAYETILQMKASGLL
jgi:hypothetical protein